MFENIEDLLAAARPFKCLKGNVRQGRLPEQATLVFAALAEAYGAEVDPQAARPFFATDDDLRVGLHRSSRSGAPTIDINWRGELYKIRCRDE